MAASRLCRQAAAAGVAVVAVLVADSSGLLPQNASVALDDCAQLTGGLAAAVCCAVTAKRTSGVERAWRRLMAIGMGGWTIGQLIWSWYQVFAKTPLPSPSLADVGYLTLPVLAFIALLLVAAEGLGEQRRRTVTVGSAGRGRSVLVLDGLVIVGSLLILTWATALGAVLRAGAPTRLAFAVAIAYPITDLILVVMVMLLLATRPLPARLRPQLALLGLGLVGLSASDSVFAWIVASGATEMPPITNAGFIAGPILVALAALATTQVRPAPVPALPTGTGGWMHLLLPYLPLGATGLVMVGQQTAGRQLDPVETYLTVGVVTLVVVRQLITLIDNNVLLGRVSDAQRQLRYQAYHDPLTGLANRALFRGRLADATAGNRFEGHPVALYFIDLDDFKLVNDGLGHSSGDRVLQEVAQRLRGCVRGVDVVARLGGDEFGVLIEGDVDQPDRLGQRMLGELRRPYDVNGVSVSVGASLGVAVLDAVEPGLTADAFLRRADAAMYAGKRRGKGLVVLYGSDTADGYGPDLPTLLAEALASGPTTAGLDVHYQPIVRLSDGVLVAMEALARWTHPSIGSVPATVFVAVAERAGLIGGLDDFVLDRSCRDLAEHLERHGGETAVHVNISASRLGSPDLEVVVRDTLDRYSLPPRHLVLEVTESSRIPDPRAAAASALRLRAMGVRLALDDFGTGYNTLAQLTLLPLDIVKLDRSLTTAGHDEKDAGRSEAVCGSVVRIAAGLSITVVAEGVETTEQAAALLRAGCQYGQGHLFGRPMPLTDGARATAQPS